MSECTVVRPGLVTIIATLRWASCGPVPQDAQRRVAIIVTRPGRACRRCSHLDRHAVSSIEILRVFLNSIAVLSLNLRCTRWSELRPVLITLKFTHNIAPRSLHTLPYNQDHILRFGNASTLKSIICLSPYQHPTNQGINSDAVFPENSDVSNKRVKCSRWNSSDSICKCYT